MRITNKHPELRQSILERTFLPLIGDVVENTDNIAQVVFLKDEIEVYDRAGHLERIPYIMLNHNEILDDLLVWFQDGDRFIPLGLASFEYN